MNKYKFIFLLIVPLIVSFTDYSCKIAVLKYNGGGDWYANPTSLNNLIEFCQANLNMNINTTYDVVDVESSELFRYPFIHMTGHGNIIFNNNEVDNLRKYLLAGGFLHIDDNYGMDPYVRREIAKLFPQKKLEELTSNHPIFHMTYKFPNGLPKIHEHDAKQSQALGISYNGRLVLLYTFESDLGDGWEDQEVHNNSEKIREEALKMGANILEYIFSN